jgi:Txe/YoeB family toxin of toxin-antitoxin system
MKFNLVFTEDFKSERRILERNHPKAIRKLSRLISEIEEDPFNGIGDPHAYTGYDKCWSRKIIGCHRLVYFVDAGTVIFAGCLGHHDDH